MYDHEFYLKVEETLDNIRSTLDGIQTIAEEIEDYNPSSAAILSELCDCFNTCFNVLQCMIDDWMNCFDPEKKIELKKEIQSFLVTLDEVFKKMNRSKNDVGI